MATATLRRPSLEATVGAVGALAVVAIMSIDLAPLAFVALVAIPAGALVAARPQRGLLAIAALLPYDGLVNILPVPSIVAAWKEALLLGTLFAALIHPHRQPIFGRRSAPIPRWTATWLALIALGVISAGFVGGANGLFGVKVWFFWSLTLVVQRVTPWNAHDRDRFVSIFMVNGAITAAFGVLQQLLGHAALNRLGWQYGTDIRTTGAFLRSFSTFDGGPFPFAYYLAIVLVIGGAVALRDPRRVRNQWFLVSVPLLVLGLLSAFTRGAWVLAAVGIGWLAVTRHHRLLLALPLALSLVVLVPPDVVSSALSSSSTVERAGIWETALDVAATHPVGVGIGSAGAAAARAAANQGATGALLETDNQWLLAFYEFGAIGLALLVGLMVGLFGAVRHASSLPGDDGALAAGTAGVILGAAAAFVFASLLQIFPFDAYLWLLAGAVHGAMVERAEARAPAPQPIDPASESVGDGEVLSFATGGVRRPLPAATGRVHWLRGPNER